MTNLVELKINKLKFKHTLKESEVKLTKKHSGMTFSETRLVNILYIIILNRK